MFIKNCCGTIKHDEYGRWTLWTSDWLSSLFRRRRRTKGFESVTSHLNLTFSPHFVTFVYRAEKIPCTCKKSNGGSPHLAFLLAYWGMASFQRTSDGSDAGERPRKRVRKGTKSCWECEYFLAGSYAEFTNKAFKVKGGKSDVNWVLTMCRFALVVSNEAPNVLVKSFQRHMILKEARTLEKGSGELSIY